MINKDQVAEATKMFNEPLGITEDDLFNFASHFYKQGLLDAAEKCNEMAKKYQFDIYAVDCGETLRRMAVEVGK
jgi:hypothetical protein